ncbi:MAG: hypothetical protein EXS42_10290 [Lacunisphaera sp.]|nr:hypothetical protein [Lacunisphaera sp.]
MRLSPCSAAILLAAARLAAAEPTWHLSLQLYSLHEHTSAVDLTNNTPGLGIMRVTEDHWLAGAGIFRNSLARTAGYVYLGKQWPLGKVRAGVSAGLTHRYNYNNGGLVPLGGALVTIPLADRWALDLIGIPRIGNYTYTTLHFAVRWQFR